MANVQARFPENGTGAYYVDEQCIDCDLCRTVASSNFKRENAKGYSYVYKQPDTDHEMTTVRQALQECPVEAIGSDG